MIFFFECYLYTNLIDLMHFIGVTEFLFLPYSKHVPHLDEDPSNALNLLVAAYFIFKKDEMFSSKLEI